MRKIYVDLQFTELSLSLTEFQITYINVLNTYIEVTLSPSISEKSHRVFQSQNVYGYVKWEWNELSFPYIS